VGELPDPNAASHSNELSALAAASAANANKERGGGGVVASIVQEAPQPFLAVRGGVRTVMDHSTLSGRVCYPGMGSEKILGCI
jgi:hypothetical protein